MYDVPQPRFKAHFMFIAINLAISVALLAVSRRLPGFGEWYARMIFPIFPNSMGRLASFAPFSLIECIAIGLTVALPILLAWKVSSALKRRRSWEDELPRKSFGQHVLRFCCLVSCLFLLFVLTFGVNFNRHTIAQQAGLEIREISVGELRQLYRLLADRIDELTDEGFSGGRGTENRSGGLALPLGAADSLPLGSTEQNVENAGSFIRPLLVLDDDDALRKTAIKTMEKLSESYPGLIRYYPEAKPVFFSRLLSYCQVSGFFSFFTMEANFNRHMPTINKPFTICHELAHISGFAREDEANFVSYLACSQSEDLYFRYSGAASALSYVLDAIYRSVDVEEYLALCEYLPVWVWQDMDEDRQYWNAHKGKTSEIFQTANDTFLKVNNQEDGVQSYGRMLYLLLAHYRENGRLGLYSDAPEPVLADINLSPDDLLHSANIVLADRETGIILFAKDSGARAEPASVTKILTAVIAIELIADLDAKVTMKLEDFTDLYRRGASLSGFDVGEVVSYRDLLYTLMMISGCDSAYALANNLCGSLPGFADKMNERVAALGLSDSRFVDPSGLTAPEHYTSAEDTVKILSYALQNPVFRQIFEARDYTIQPTNMKPEEREIRNSYFSRLERDHEGGYLENGALLLGGKTGFTNAAGLCLATLGEFEGREYIVVILGGPGTNRTPQYNFMDAMTLFGALESRQFLRQAG